MQDERIEQWLDAALRKPPEVRIPPHFSSRTLARLPGAAGSRIVPATAVAAAVLFVVLGTLLVSTENLTAWLNAALRQPSLLLTTLAIEAVLSIAWLLRVAIPSSFSRSSPPAAGSRKSAGSAPYSSPPEPY